MVQSEESTHWRWPLAFRDDDLVKEGVAAVMTQLWQERKVMMMLLVMRLSKIKGEAAAIQRKEART